MTTKDKAEIKKMLQDSLIEFWDHVFPTIATKNDLIELKNNLTAQMNSISSDVKDIKRRVTDLETDTPSRTEFNQLKAQVKTIISN
jgi:hypothetical protein